MAGEEAVKQRRFVWSWWKTVGVLCVLPTVAVVTVGFNTIPKMPRCIGAQRDFYRGIQECATEMDRRRQDLRENMMTGRVLLRTFVLCANLEALRRDVEHKCSWVVGDKK